MELTYNFYGTNKQFNAFVNIFSESNKEFIKYVGYVGAMLIESKDGKCDIFLYRKDGDLKLKSIKHSPCQSDLHDSFVRAKELLNKTGRVVLQCKVSVSSSTHLRKEYKNALNNGGAEALYATDIDIETISKATEYRGSWFEIPLHTLSNSDINPTPSEITKFGGLNRYISRVYDVYCSRERFKLLTDVIAKRCGAEIGKYKEATTVTDAEGRRVYLIIKESRDINNYYRIHEMGITEDTYVALSQLERAYIWGGGGLFDVAEAIMEEFSLLKLRNNFDS